MQKIKTSFDDLEVFHRIVSAGSLSAAGREMGLSPAVVCRRLQKLEKVLGVRLIQRSTRNLKVTEIGAGYYNHVSTVLAAMDHAQAYIKSGSELVQGPLKVSVPTTFSRLHIVPWLGVFLARHPELSLKIDLTDTFTDIIGGGYDVAIRISSAPDPALTARHLCPNHRLICASPEYLKRNGVPRTLDELKAHKILATSNHTAWSLAGPKGREIYKVNSFISTNSSDFVRELTLAGLGIALRSTWDVGPQIKCGKLVRILDQFCGSADTGIRAVYPSSRQVPIKVKTFVNYLAKIYGQKPYWNAGLSL